ncbi:hypothetical protein [Streptosporangium sp. NPDC002721]
MTATTTFEIIAEGSTVTVDIPTAEAGGLAAILLTNGVAFQVA